MKQYPYSWPEYVKAQVAANKRKQHVVWVNRDNIRFVCDYAGPVKTIVCHGTRNGAEQKYFSEFRPEAEIIGTEISPMAVNYPMTIQHDFHEPLGIHSGLTYTNSLDHAFDPEGAIKTWLSETDLLFIEHSDCDFDDKVTEHDPFGASFDEVADIIQRHGRIDVLADVPVKHRGAREHKLFICRP